MDRTQELFLNALRCALHSERVAWSEPLSDDEWSGISRLAREHGVLPLLAEALNGSSAAGSNTERWEALKRYARELTVTQACRTAEFKLLYHFLCERGLRPVIVKGIVCRALYPQPEQRVTVDEDLFIRTGELDEYTKAFEEYCLVCDKPDAAAGEEYETTFKDGPRRLYIELHTALFPTGSGAYGDCNLPFEGALDRSIEAETDGFAVRTLSPTDHLLYLMLHAYKHFLHSGMGLRHVCDIGLYASAHETDSRRIRRVCDELSLSRLFAAVFAIGTDYLGLKPYPAFDDLDEDPEPLLGDMLTGGLYGTADVNRAHSSHMTLEAAEAQKSGRRSRGFARALFPPKKTLEAICPALKKHPILLPYAWAKRLWVYLGDRREGAADPVESLKIGSERVALLENYGVIGGRRHGRRR